MMMATRQLLVLLLLLFARSAQSLLLTRTVQRSWTRFSPPLSSTTAACCTLSRHRLNMLHSSTEVQTPNIAANIPEKYFLRFSELRRLSAFPRLGLTSTHEIVALDAIDTTTSLLIFISHSWLRGSPLSPHWTGQPDPDNAQREKFGLCVAGIDRLLQGLTRGISDCDCFVWLDYSCINQDKNPAAELSQLDSIVGACDLIFTPIVDGDLDWELKRTVDGPFVDYKAKLWNQGERAYLNRAWCRVEMFYAANIPLPAAYRDKKAEKLLFGLKARCLSLRRAHVLFGSRELQERRTPLVLPPLSNSYFEQYHPVKGSLSVKDDAGKIEDLVSSLLPYMDFAETKYLGDYNGRGEMHGRGRFYMANGDFYEGEFEDGAYHGYGEYVSSAADIYLGEFIDGRHHGWGKLISANGAIFEGEFLEGYKHGRGISTYPDGTVHVCEWRRGKKDGFGRISYGQGGAHEGEWRDNLKHGPGTEVSRSVCEYTGEFVDGKRHGYGVLTTKASGEARLEWRELGIVGHWESVGGATVYEGMFSEDRKCGAGKLTFSNGDVFEGHFKDDLRAGRGVFYFKNGDLLEGLWTRDKKEGLVRFTRFDGIAYECEFSNDELVGRTDSTFVGVAVRPAYMEGHVYAGEHKAGSGCIRHGRGKYIYPDGAVYDGEWRDDKKHGQGVYVTSAGDRYEGGWVEGRRCGFARLNMSDGSFFEGQFANHSINGTGRLICSNGDVYDGEFRNNKKHGRGRHVTARGTTYTGDFARNKRHGNGTLVSSNGAMYEGQFANDKKAGFGRLTSASGSQYAGGWLDDKMQGEGRYVSGSGSVYQGGWACDLKNGFGVYSSPCTGSVYAGPWVDNVRHGSGARVTYANGDSYEGDYLNGKMHGRGRFTYHSSGEVFQGEFVEGRRCGQGRLSRPDGSFTEALWDGDKVT